MMKLDLVYKVFQVMGINRNEGIRELTEVCLVATIAVYKKRLKYIFPCFVTH